MAASQSGIATAGRSPTWGETFRFEVEDPASQTVDVVVVDRATQETVGEASIRLADLQPGQSGLFPGCWASTTSTHKYTLQINLHAILCISVCSLRTHAISIFRFFSNLRR